MTVRASWSLLQCQTTNDALAVRVQHIYTAAKLFRLRGVLCKQQVKNPPDKTTDRHTVRQSGGWAAKTPIERPSLPTNPATHHHLNMHAES